jgi:thymidylate synthase
MFYVKLTKEQIKELEKKGGAELITTIYKFNSENRAAHYKTLVPELEDYYKVYINSKYLEKLNAVSKEEKKEKKELDPKLMKVMLSRIMPITKTVYESNIEYLDLDQIIELCKAAVNSTVEALFDMYL